MIRTTNFIFRREIFPIYPVSYTMNISSGMWIGLIFGLVLIHTEVSGRCTYNWSDIYLFCPSSFSFLIFLLPLNETNRVQMKQFVIRNILTKFVRLENRTKLFATTTTKKLTTVRATCSISNAATRETVFLRKQIVKSLANDLRSPFYRKINFWNMFVFVEPVMTKLYSM